MSHVIFHSCGNAQALIFCWLPPLLLKVDATTFEVNMTKYSQRIMKKQFLQQLKVRLHKQTLFCNTYIEKDSAYSF